MSDPDEAVAADQGDPANEPATGRRAADRDHEPVSPPSRSFRRPPSIRTLEGRSRSLMWGLLALAVLLPLASAALALADGWVATGDNALIGLRTRDVLSLDVPLVGQPTTGENYSDAIPSSHPGAMEFYLLAPFVGILGNDAGLAMGAAAINAVALVALVWAGFRRGGVVLAGLVSLVAFMVSYSIGADQLHDPLSSVVGVFPAFAMVLLGWCVLGGDDDALVPWILAATFTLQVHLSYLAFGGPFVAIVLGVVVARLVRQARDRDPGRPWLRWVLEDRRPVAIGAFVGVLLWLPVFIEQFTASPGNLTAIVDTLGTEKAPGRGWGFGFERLLRSVAPPPVFTRQLAPLQHLEKVSAIFLVLGVAVFAVLGVLVWRARARSPRLVTTLAIVTGVTSLTGVYSASSLPGGATLKVANFRWMWIVAALVWLAVVWLGYLLALPRLGRRRSAAPVVAVVAALLGAVLALGSHDFAEERDAAVMSGMPALLSQIHQELPPGTYRVALDGSSAVLTVGPAVVYDLVGRGDTVYIRAGAFGRAYGDLRADHGGRVDGQITVHSGDAETATAGEVIARGAFADGGGKPYKVWVSLDE